MKDMVSSGMGAVKMMGPDGCYEPAMLESAGEVGNGRFYATFAGLPVEELEKTERGKRFMKGTRSASAASRPSPTRPTGTTPAGWRWRPSRRAGRKDRDAIREAGVGIKDFDGTAGRWSFDANGDTTLRVMSGFVIEAGDWKFVDRLTVDKK